MPNDAEMLARLRKTAGEDWNLTLEQEEDIRWAVARIVELEGALTKISLRVELWADDKARAGSSLNAVYSLASDALAPAPAKEGESTDAR